MDRDERSIALARTSGQARLPEIRYVQADFLAETVKPGSFDLVTAVASLHHMNAEPALRKMADVLRPGGVLVIIGLARDLSLTRRCLDRSRHDRQLDASCRRRLEPQVPPRLRLPTSRLWSGRRE
jgi:SAM-dependent methyltransferase